MISQRYYYKNWKSDEVPEGSDLFVTGAGRFRLINMAEKQTNYPPRNNCQLLYIKSGECYYRHNDIEGKAGKGSVVIWPVGHQKSWCWKLEDEPDVYWVQFCGNKVSDILKSLGLDKKVAFSLPENDAHTGTFEKIMQELHYRQTNYCELCTAYLWQILLTVSRDIETVANRKRPLPPEIIRTVKYMEEHCHEEIYLETLASINFIGKSWLIRQFKHYLNTSPMQYLNNLRIEKAASLLREGADIDIAATVSGFSDRLYFSKVFKEKTGFSPGRYRKIHID